MTPITWTFLHPQASIETLGYLADWIYEDDPDDAVSQIHKHYKHVGGWRDFKGFTLLSEGSMTYPGDPVLSPIARARLRDETIYFYPGAWITVVQPDGSSRTARID